MGRDKKRKTKGAADFEAHFARIFGARWKALRAALLVEPRKAVLSNPFGLQDYALDEGSLAAAEALDVKPGESVADLCASPGGKSLVTLFAARGQGQWLCNDLSPARVKRLKAVLHDCLPPEVLSRVHVTASDASRFGLKHKDKFDKVLVDAPCSGERHMLASPQEIARWSEKGSKRLAVRQHALLCAGLDSAKPGGRIVYSTCTISPHENDAVVAKLLKSRAGRFEVLPAMGRGEATEYGRILLPDAEGCGPIYYAVLQKLESAD